MKGTVLQIIVLIQALNAAFFGVILAAVGYFIRLSTLKIRGDTKKADGVVVAVGENCAAGSVQTQGSVCNLTIEYIDRKTKQVIRSDFETIGTWAVGDTLEVLYLKENPEEIKTINAQMPAWVGWMVMILSLILIGYAALLVIYRKSKWVQGVILINFARNLFGV